MIKMVWYNKMWDGWLRTLGVRSVQAIQAVLLAHASLDTEGQVLCHEASLNGLYAHSLEVLSKGRQILVVCERRKINYHDNMAMDGTQNI